MHLNPYQIKWAIFVDENNVLDTQKSFFGADQKSLDKKLATAKGRFFVITDMQFGLTQNRWSKQSELKPNTNLSVHFLVKNKLGGESMIPMTKKQFENPIIK